MSDATSRTSQGRKKLSKHWGLAPLSDWKVIEKKLDKEFKELGAGQFPAHLSVSDARKSEIYSRWANLSQLTNIITSVVRKEQRESCAIQSKELQKGFRNNQNKRYATSTLKNRISLLAHLIQAVEPKLNLAHVARLDKDSAQIVYQKAAKTDKSPERVIRSRKSKRSSALVGGWALVKEVSSPPASPVELLLERGVSVLGRFDGEPFQEFQESISGAQDIFILQNLLPHSPTLLQRIFSRVKQLQGKSQVQVRLTVYKPDSSEAKKRAEQTVEFWKREHPDTFANKLIHTMASFHRGQSEVIEQGLNEHPVIEMRFAPFALPFVVYATEHRVWVGWLWLDGATTEKLQFSAAKGSPYFQVIWDYLNAAWDKSARIEWSKLSEALRKGTASIALGGSTSEEAD